MTTFESWLRNRRKPGTLEYMARQISSSKRGYQESVDSLKPLLLAEMFIDLGCNATLLSKEIGIHRNSIYRLLNEAGLSAEKLRKIQGEAK